MFIYKHFHKSFIIVCSLLLFSCGGGGGTNGGDACISTLKTSLSKNTSPQVNQADWTVLLYLAGDNNLSQAAMADIAEMEAVGSTASVNVVVQLDTKEDTTKRLLVGQGSSVTLSDLGEQNMADPCVLTDFITWGFQQYPADRMALILWSHGDGHQKPDVGAIHELSLRNPYGILQDDTDGVGCCQSNLLIRQAIEDAGEHFDLLGFDASMMGQIETAYEFNDVADLIVFSQEIGQANGWEYTGILQGLTDMPDMDAIQLSDLMVKTYEDFYENVFYPANPGFGQTLTISAIQMGTAISNLAVAIDDAAQALMNDLGNPDTVNAITSARAQSQDLAGTFCNVYTDLFDWLEWLKLQPGLDQATMDAIGAALSLKSAVILSEYHGQAREGAMGLSIVFFKDPNPGCTNFDPDYLDGTSLLAFIGDTLWDDFLSAYYETAGWL
jgi:hypothetical protein